MVCNRHGGPQAPTCIHRLPHASTGSHTLLYLRETPFCINAVYAKRNKQTTPGGTPNQRPPRRCLDSRHRSPPCVMGDERRHIRWSNGSSDASDPDLPKKDGDGAARDDETLPRAHLSEPCAAVAHNAPAPPLPAINGLPRLAWRALPSALSPHSSLGNAKCLC